MKLSTRARYGLRAMADLALYSHGRPVALLTIAQRQAISDGYLESIFSTLKKAGLVTAVKGAGGGYSLSRAASDIRVSEILSALEGDLSIVAEDGTEGGEQCLRRFIQENVWSVVSQNIHTLVHDMSLQDLIDQKAATENAPQRRPGKEQTHANQNT